MMWLVTLWWPWAFVAYSVAVLYLGCLIGANSPQTFTRSRRALERIANSASAKAQELAMRGRE